MNHTQVLLVIGAGIVVLAMAALNFRPFIYGAVHLVRSPEKYTRRYDLSRMKSYLTWVFGLTALCCLYNIAVSWNATYVGQFTVIEFFLLAVGLVAVKLQKEDDTRKNKPSK